MRTSPATLQRALSTTRFRVYASADVRGVQLCGAAKNVIAIAAGISDGLGFGDNARAALITRGLAEMTRLGSALGADPRTYAGLAGLGDLVATCTSRHSRNRAAGELLARGVAPRTRGARRSAWSSEGLHTAPALAALAREAGVDLPITDAVCSVIARHVDPRGARDAARAGRAGRASSDASGGLLQVGDRRARRRRARARRARRGRSCCRGPARGSPAPAAASIGAAVDALARERVVDVADAQDAHLERELAAAQAVGIAAAVEALVVAAHERRLAGEAADVPEQRRAVARVALDHGELRRRQRAGLAQDLVRHLQLADVVQQRGDRQAAQARAAQAELLADLDGELRDAARVLARRGVLDREAREQARHPGAEQRLLLGHDVCGRRSPSAARATAWRARGRSRARP